MDLRAEVFREPGDLAVKQVYADALIEQGDPRGDFIRIQCELDRASGDDRERLLALERRLLEAHERAWLAPIRDDLLSWRWRHGFVYRVTTNESRWAMGARNIVAHEPVRRVQITGVKKVAMVVGPALAQIAALALPDDRLSSKKVAALCASEHVRGLRGLDLSGNPIDVAGLRVLAETPFPSLVELRLFRCGFAGDSFGADALRALFAAPWLHQLRELDVSGCTIGHRLADPEGIAGLLVGGAPLDSCRMLDLSHNHLADVHARQLIDSKLPRLRLCIEANHDISAELRAALAQRFELVPHRWAASRDQLADESALDDG